MDDKIEINGETYYKATSVVHIMLQKDRYEVLAKKYTELGKELDDVKEEYERLSDEKWYDKELVSLRSTNRWQSEAIGKMKTLCDSLKENLKNEKAYNDKLLQEQLHTINECQTLYEENKKLADVAVSKDELLLEFTPHETTLHRNWGFQDELIIKGSNVDITLYGYDLKHKPTSKIKIVRSPL